MRSPLQDTLTHKYKGAMFKELIHEELHCFLEGMTKSMKWNFKFVNVLGRVYHNVMNQ